nr:GDSL esterase/lipase At1g28580-like [Ipomoea batatas]
MSLPIVACALLLTALASSQFVDGCYTSIFAFGDSLSDTGNYISLTSNGLLQYDGIPSCSVPPYGETFFHHPTGRCSDGRVINRFHWLISTCIAAEQFGLPLVPPYSGGRKNANRGGGGVNFAVVGAPALTEDVTSVKRELLSRQYLHDVSDQHPSFFLAGCDEIFDKSLIVFGPFGGDDYASAILSKRVEDALRLQPLVNLTLLHLELRLCSSKSEENMSTLRRRSKAHREEATADLKVATAAADSSRRSSKPKVRTAAVGSCYCRSLKLAELIKLGVVNLMVPGMLPDGCIGVSFTVYYGSDEEDYDPITGCLTWLNEFAQKHNGLLRKELTRIQELYPNVSITYADYYNAGLELFLSPKKYGFNDESRLIACCGSGGPYNVDDDAKCGYPSSHACDDPSSYIQWDGAHLTQAAYQWIAKGLLSGLYTSPNITASCSSTSAKWI